MKILIPLVLCFLVSCASIPSQTPINLEPEKSAIETLLDNFHQAASKADGASYFETFHPDGVFIGTDKTERWTLDEFKAFAEPYFSKGKGWTYLPKERHVMVSSSGLSAWFDEQLFNEKYGNTRGSGALIKDNGKWKLTHYVLSFPIPNDAVKEVVPIVQKHETKEN